MGEALAAPFLDASYVRDPSETYVDGLNNPIAAQEIEQSQVALGLDLAQAFAANGGMLTSSGGFSVI